MNIKQLISKIEDEGWTAYKKNGTYQVEAYGKTFPLVHPFSIYSKLYREEENGDLKYQFLKKMHDMLWPGSLWHFWTERRFKTHCDDWRIITYAGGAGTSKAQPLTSKVATPSGFKLMGDVEIGDIILTPTGTAKIIAVHEQGIKPCYRVSFSDGTFADCAEGHLWTLYSHKDRDKGRSPKTLQVEDIELKRDYSVPFISPIEGISDNLPLPAYCLGVLLGDGHIGKTNISIHVESEEKINGVMPEFCKLWPTGNTRKGHYLPKKLFNILGKLGLRGKLSTQKFIPTKYLYASLEDRLNLFWGLMDTDGCSPDTRYR